MIDCIIGAAVKYSPEQVRPFVKSLFQANYTGRCLLFVDRQDTALEVERWGWEALAPGAKHSRHPHSSRFYWIKDAIPEDVEGVLCLDTRDTIFQLDPSSLPSEGLHFFEEDRSQTIGSCPYNSEWILKGYSPIILDYLKPRPILCVGSYCGQRAAIMAHTEALCKELDRAQTVAQCFVDQAAHNLLAYVYCKNYDIWHNEKSPVYTVGHLDRGSVQTEGEYIVNQAGEVPAVVHQWDRHDNLKDLVLAAYQ